MNNLSDNEIIKVLEYCTTDGWCSNCPHEKKCIEDEITQLALDLINRQKAEIEQLKIENRILSQKRISFPERLEIDRKARAEAVKEFAERLKEHKIDVDVSFGYGKEVYTEAVAVIEIDNLVKEMVGEG